MRRIGLAVVLTISLLLLLLAAVAQTTGRMPRIGWLATSAPGPFDEAFRQGLRERGYIEVKTLLSNGDRSKESSPACLLRLPNC